MIGLYKTELINPQRPWKTIEEVEIATLHYVDWFNNHRLYEENGDNPAGRARACLLPSTTALSLRPGPTKPSLRKTRGGSY